MRTRRNIIQAGMAAPFVFGMAGAALPAAASGGQTSHAVVDERLVEAAGFAREAARRGARVHRIRGDAGTFWLQQLSERRSSRALNIVGLTSEAGLFGLELMARDHGLRLVHRVEHRPEGNGDYRHDIPLLARDWGAAAAARALAPSLRAYRALPVRLGPSLREGPLDRATLVSWVLAPV